MFIFKEFLHFEYACLKHTYIHTQINYMSNIRVEIVNGNFNKIYLKKIYSFVFLYF